MTLPAKASQFVVYFSMKNPPIPNLTHLFHKDIRIRSTKKEIGLAAVLNSDSLPTSHALLCITSLPPNPISPIISGALYRFYLCDASLLTASNFFAGALFFSRTVYAFACAYRGHSIAACLCSVTSFTCAYPQSINASVCFHMEI